MIGSVSRLDLSQLLRIQPRGAGSRPTGRASTSQDLLRRRTLDDLAEKLGSLRSGIDRLQSAALTPGGRRVRGRIAQATTSPLGLAATPRDPTLRSSGEINPTPTSFTPFGPVVSGSTTSLPTIGGVYDGDQGDDTLTFEFRQNGVVGSGQRIDVRVYDGGGRRIETLRFEDVPVDTPITLQNGLTLTLGSGSVTRRDTFEVQVSASVGSQVDPTKPFDGTRNDQPNFAPGTSVGAGAFEVNGVSIDVAANDSIDAVLAKIDAAVVGVTARFDAVTDSVVLTHDDVTGTIVVGNDSSGFLAATKLDGAIFEPGQDDTLANDPITGVNALSGVRDGVFTINDVSIAVDTATDSLEDLVARINASSANVTATLDSTTFELSIVSRRSDRAFTLADDSSGFFTAVGLGAATYRPVEGSGPPRSGFRDLAAVERELNALGSVLDDLLSPMRGALSDLDFVRDQLRTAVEDSFDSFFQTGSRSTFRSGFGLDFDFTRDDPFDFDAKRFERASIEAFDDLQEFVIGLGGDGAATGLLASLARAAEDLGFVLDARRGTHAGKGGSVDLRA